MTNPNLPVDWSRRGFLKSSAALVGAATVVSSTIAGAQTSRSTDEKKPAAPAPAPAGPFQLPALPYKPDALAPHISANTVDFHYNKHHKGYVDKLNKAVEGKPLAEMKLEQVIQTTLKDPEQASIFNSAAQVWNHTFYWNSMKPGGGGEPTGRVADKIKSDFGDFATFKKQFAEAANGQFGSGWAWLVMKDGKLEVHKTGNADNPLAHGNKPLITCDVWEHAYYLDYQNKRADYVTAYLEHLVNWEFANANL